MTNDTKIIILIVIGAALVAIRIIDVVLTAIETDEEDR